MRGSTGILTAFFFSFLCYQGISQRAVRTSLGPIPSRGRSVPEYQRKPIATCDFPEGVVQTPCPPSGYYHAVNVCFINCKFRRFQFFVDKVVYIEGIQLFGMNMTCHPMKLNVYFRRLSFWSELSSTFTYTLWLRATEG